MNRLGRPLEREQVLALLPHRPPILLVDRVTAVYGPPRSELRASYEVLPDHPVLAGHFPGRPIWPGALTIEGLAQAANLLALLLPMSAAPDALDALESGDPSIIPDHRGWLAAVEVKLLHPVGPGDRLDYAVRLTASRGAMSRVNVSAAVGRREVARGSIAVATQQDHAM